MAHTVDNVLYDSSLGHDGESSVKPFLSKETIYVIDENGSSDYSRNQIVFNTISISNNGRYSDFSEGYISIPVVVSMSRDTQHVADESQGIKFKSGPVIIDSVAIDYGNGSVIQQRKDISAWCSFKQHSTYSLGDEKVMGLSHNYYKPARGFTGDDVLGLQSQDTSIDGNQFTYLSAEEQAYQSNQNLREAGVDYYEKHGNTHIFYKDFRVRLKDLFFFDQMPMVRGANIKITLTLNQADLVQTFTAGELTDASYSLKGSTCPIMRVNQTQTNDFVETIKVSVAKAGIYTHQKNQCRLYVDTYMMEESHEASYLSKGVQKITYDDVLVSTVKGLSGSFQNLISNSLSRMKRLIIVPMINKADNAHNYSPMESPYCSEPATCSPHYIRDFQVSLSGQNVYSQSIETKYDQFLNELEGKFGLNGGRTDGLSSSLISMKDFESTFGYLVVDLSRRREADNLTPLALEIKGTVSSPKSLDLLIFCEFERDLSLDLATGATL